MKPNWTVEYIMEKFNVQEGDFIEYTVLRGRRPHKSKQNGVVAINQDTGLLQIRPKNHPSKYVKFYNGMIKVEKLGE